MPPTPSGFSTLWSGPATKPSSDIDMSNLTLLMPLPSSTSRETSRWAELIGCGCQHGRPVACVPFSALTGGPDCGCSHDRVGGGGRPARDASAEPRTEVVVTLDAPSLADFVQSSRVLTVQAKAKRLDLQSASSVSYLRELDARQSAVARRIERAIPSATVRWRYRIVVDGLAVVLPTNELPALARIGGVRTVYPDTKYHLALDSSPELIGADQLWGLPNFTTAGNGIKIGIIDEGIDQVHPFFSPAGYVYPAGYPKGNTSYTTPKVIAARAFPPPGETWQYANTPFDPVFSDHATHVAGIAAGDYTVNAVSGRGPLSGVAPRAYLGNYKAFTVPTRRVRARRERARGRRRHRGRGARTAWT